MKTVSLDRRKHSPWAPPLATTGGGVSLCATRVIGEKSAHGKPGVSDDQFWGRLTMKTRRPGLAIAFDPIAFNQTVLGSSPSALTNIIKELVAFTL